MLLHLSLTLNESCVWFNGTIDFIVQQHECDQIYTEEQNPFIYSI